MNRKIQIVPAPITISASYIQAGDQTTSIPMANVASASSNNISIMVNGASYPLTPQHGSTFAYPNSYHFHYDIMADYKKMYGDLFPVDNVNLDVMALQYFWGTKDFFAWFDQCKGEIFAQNHSSSGWRFAFTDEEDQKAFQKRITQRRDHRFEVVAPADEEYSAFVMKVQNWCADNLQHRYLVQGNNWHGDRVVYMEVEDKAEAVMAKLVWVDGNKEKELP